MRCALKLFFGSFFFAYDCPNVPKPLFKNTIPSPFIYLYTFFKMTWLVQWPIFVWVYFCAIKFHWSTYFTFHWYHTELLLWLCSKSWNQIIYLLNLFPFFKIGLAVLFPLFFIISYRTSISIPEKILVCWEFDWDCIIFINQIEDNWHCNSIESSHQYRWYLLQIFFDFFYQSFIVSSIQSLHIFCLIIPFSFFEQLHSIFNFKFQSFIVI